MIQALTILFIALKLTGYISWPWLWVISPIFIESLIWIFIVIAYIVYYKR